MCFSFAASLASFVVGLSASGTLVAYLVQVDDLQQPEKQLTIGIAAFCAHAFLMQGVEALAHWNHLANRAVISVDVIGTLAYVIVALQPLHLLLVAFFAINDAVSFGAILCLVAAVVIGVHTVLCLALDAPINRWLRIDVEPLKLDSLSYCAILYRFFTPRESSKNDTQTLYGSLSRTGIYFLGTAIAGITLAFEGLRLLNDDDVWRERVGVAVLSFEVACLVLLGLAQCLGEMTTKGHPASLWCFSILFALLVFGLMLHEIDFQPVIWAGAHAIGWVVLFLGIQFVSELTES